VSTILEPGVIVNDDGDIEYAAALDHLDFCKKWLVDQKLDGEWKAIVPHEDKQLFIDLDTAEQHAQFLRMWPLVKSQYENIDYTLSFSKRGRVHIMVNMKRYTSFLMRVALQSILGSDPKREALHIVSYEKQELNPIVLIERIKPLMLCDVNHG
jgi:hypothetical protein